MTARSQDLERCGAGLTPNAKMGGHASDKVYELAMLVYRGFDERLLNSEFNVAGMEFPEERVAEPRAHAPIALERIDIADGMPPFRWLAMFWRSSGVWLSI